MSDKFDDFKNIYTDSVKTKKVFSYIREGLAMQAPQFNVRFLPTIGKHYEIQLAEK